MIVRPHLILTLLLVARCLTSDGLPIMVDLISCQDVVGRIRAQLEMMSLQFMQLTVVQFCLLHMLPRPKERLISGLKRPLLSHTQTATPKRVTPTVLVGIGQLGIEFLAVGGCVSTRCAAQIEMSGSLVHLAVIFIIQDPGIHQEETDPKMWKI